MCIRDRSTRVELRSPDPCCNPYLELAVCLAAGLDGIEKGMVPPAEITENIFAMDEDVYKRQPMALSWPCTTAAECISMRPCSSSAGTGAL